MTQYKDNAKMIIWQWAMDILADMVDEAADAIEHYVTDYNPDFTLTVRADGVFGMTRNNQTSVLTTDASDIAVIITYATMGQ